jgi:hypothetical protein
MRLLGLFVMIVAVGPVVAEQPKPSWRFSLEERVALRTNPALAQERVRRMRHDANREVATDTTQEWVDHFDGRTHPELFMPHEVFDKLIKMAFLGSTEIRQVIHGGLTPEIRQHGLPPDFWARLEAISSVHVADYRSVLERHDDRGIGMEGVLAHRHEALCRSRVEALAAAREAFGAERFRPVSVQGHCGQHVHGFRPRGFGSGVTRRRGRVPVTGALRVPAVTSEPVKKSPACHRYGVR